MGNNRGKGDLRLPKIGFFILIILYLIVARFTRYCATSDDVLVVMGQPLAITSFAGAFDSVQNGIIICLVVFYGIPGFVISLFFYAITIFNLMSGIIFSHNLLIFPGFFTGLVSLLAVVLIFRRNREIEKLQNNEIKHLKEQQVFSQKLFEQTATALVSAIDAKDEYSRGHSLRVAEYSVKIAKAMGKDEEDCREVYYAALLHDVGKIGISDVIINKNGMPTDEEYDVIMQHPIIGNQILSSISEYPYLSIGAHYHHERFDGKGYPDGLKGEDIPEIARIIAVADTFDAMTSSRSYRDALPQQLAWEEIIKGSGTQFDPEIVKIAQCLVDIDGEFSKREKNTLQELLDKGGMHFGEYRSEISVGVLLSPFITKMNFKYHCDEVTSENRKGPSMVFFDSFDGRAHEEESIIRELSYFEYCEVTADGTVIGDGTRKVKTNVIEYETSEEAVVSDDAAPIDRVYDIEAVKCIDHLLVRIDDGVKKVEVIVALPDSTRFVYMGLTGEYCDISDVSIAKSKDKVAEDYIPRIAEFVSYLDGPEGDVPNVQINSHRTQATKGVPIDDELTLTFHTKSLPAARLIWHCAYAVLFSSKSGEVDFEAPDYHEYALIRLDGESWEDGKYSSNRIIVNMNDNFDSWEAWKKGMKEGTDCTITFKRDGNTVISTTEVLGLFIKNKTTLKEDCDKLYAAITGDICAITNVRVNP
ncbi:HD-GYP domain-containing protein [Butyrivibrio sp. WCD2001]|uniref:HD-GYP domain-containing protein n=1 Tax=Butyrivibrio sp. WCD2001 TaxID=1280681 RepID=UPI000403075B|nr:HD-GYP domain-containing protein [Butyrivibrio sp. WCD2001]